MLVLAAACDDGGGRSDGDARPPPDAGLHDAAPADAITDLGAHDATADAWSGSCPEQAEVLIDGEPLCDGVFRTSRRAAASDRRPIWAVHFYAICDPETRFVKVPMVLMEGLPSTFPATVEPDSVLVDYQIDEQNRWTGGRPADPGSEFNAPLQRASLLFRTRSCIEGEIVSLVAREHRDIEVRRVEVRFSGEFHLRDE